MSEKGSRGRRSLADVDSNLACGWFNCEALTPAATPVRLLAARQGRRNTAEGRLDEPARSAGMPFVLGDSILCYEGRVELTLIYEGSLPPKGRGVGEHKARLREAFHPQVKAQVEPRLGRSKSAISTLFEGHVFVSPAHREFRTAAELHVVMLTPPSARSAGDADNRLKTLIDGLTRPANPQQMHNFVPSDPDGTYCLLDDDALVRRISLDARTSYRGGSASQETLVIVTAKIVLGENVDMSSPTGNMFLVL